MKADAIREAVSGRETEVFAALGIQWGGTSGHIACPYPDHPDHDPSWRWDDKRKLAFCTCIGTRPGEDKAHSIFAVVAAKEGLDREAAKARVAEIIGRADLITGVNGRKYQRTDAAALLSPASDNRDDTLVWNYLGDVLMVTRIDRLARSIGDLQDIVRTVRARGAALKATEQPTDTNTAAGKCFLDMLGVFAEFETNLRRERQLEGIAKAKAAGVYKGRPPDRGIEGARTEGARHAALGHRQGPQDRPGIGV
jgi:hypothetical protein